MSEFNCSAGDHDYAVVNPGMCGGCEVCGDVEEYYECQQCDFSTMMGD